MSLKKDAVGEEPDLMFTVKTSDGAILGSAARKLELKPSATWEEISFSFDTNGSGQTEFFIKDSADPLNFGNDFVIDDISFTPEGYIAPEDILIPSAFTPNGDGINDTWRITSLNTNFPDCSIEIFNRYGSPVFSSKGYFNSWDGTNNGKPLPDGTYYYIINFNSTVRRSGYVLIAK
ncbi:gliding motility-associated C-terminal domain-containing protein [Rubrolithibacter danxiaensis]|uniref:gliding motility-associated C-terminal domain-containing protein n=1 Tax=Rubrolithibacter danxiaensis TaxID=3390805 RepID=UPI003BF879C6